MPNNNSWIVKNCKEKKAYEKLIKQTNNSSNELSLEALWEIQLNTKNYIINFYQAKKHGNVRNHKHILVNRLQHKHLQIKWERIENLGVIPGAGNGERTMLLDDIVKRVRNGSSFRERNLRVYLPHIHCAFSRETPHHWILYHANVATTQPIHRPDSSLLWFASFPTLPTAN